jgi:hypothetical protein
MFPLPGKPPKVWNRTRNLTRKGNKDKMGLAPFICEEQGFRHCGIFPVGRDFFHRGGNLPSYIHSGGNMNKTAVLLFLLLGPAWAEHKLDRPVVQCKFWRADAGEAFLGTYCPTLYKAMAQQWRRRGSATEPMRFVVSPPDQNGTILVTIARLDKDDLLEELHLPTGPLTKLQLRQYAKQHAAELLPLPAIKKKK